MIHEAYMPVYRCPDFHCAGGRGSTRGSTRGPRGPKNRKAEKEMEKAQKISCGAVEAPLSSNFSRLANFNNPSFCQSIL